ncbi:hypothetical protein GGP41_008948 [Bipolaris sorokiniana]|uniref:NACHT domain-containing protein n=1 Tax=Cochliobolus sativus TaxID=45130 RepID=A0A8H5ZEB9_COCSA|nr:hypothetical protein GGP41_008948 [Bipolaris sorokiniana]
MDTTASFIAIATLCEKLIKYINATQAAKDDRQRLRSQIRACSYIILQLKDEAEDSDNSEESEEWVQSMQLLFSPLHRLHEALSVAAQALSPRDSTIEKLKWPFKEQDVRKLVNAVRCCCKRSIFTPNTTSSYSWKLKTALGVRDVHHQFALGNVAEKLGRLEIGQDDVQGQVQQLHERHDLEEAIQKREFILEWLTRIDYESQQRDAIRLRQAGTGQWLLDSQQYQDWLAAKDNTLFCPGIPGAGKTVLASIINEDLRHRFHADSQIGLAHLFFDYRRQDQQSLEILLSGLLKQLVSQHLLLPKQVEDCFTIHQQEYSGRARAIMLTLEAVIASFSRVFIVLDAVDECLAPAQHCTDLLCAIQELQKRHKLQLLATSRLIPEVTERFTAASVLQIQANSQDVRKYLTEQIHRLPGFVRKDVQLQNEVVSNIVEAVQGMFLLAKLHLNSMVGKRSKKALRTSLHGLATGSQAYDAAYENAMLRIEGQLADQKELAKEALAFLTCTKHRFSKLDLEMALGAEIGNPNIDPDNFPDIYDIVTACAGLVTVNDESGTVGLAHYTTQEYLERTQQHWFPDAQALITDSCLSYLSFLASGDCRTIGLDVMWQSRGWCVYSAKNWGYHARQVPASHELIMEVLNQATDLRPTLSYMYDDLSCYRFLGPGVEIDKSLPDGLHLAAYFGLEAAFVALLKRTPDQSSEFGGRDPSLIAAFAIATYSGHEAIVRQLLLHGVLIESSIMLRHRNGRTTGMHLAAMKGHTILLKLFLEHDVDVNLCSSDGRTALHCAVACGSVPATMVLLEAQANVNIRDERGWTSLHEAAANSNGNLEIFQQLIEHGGAIDLRDHDGGMALHYAVMAGNIQFFSMLVKTQADMNVGDYLGMTPLHHAAAKDDPAILKQLLDLGASVEIVTNDGVTPLMEACSRQPHFQEKLEILLAAGADPHALDCEDQSVLVWAMHLGPKPDILRFLLNKGADPQLGASPLSYAMFRCAETKARACEEEDEEKKKEWLIWQQDWEACVQILKDFGAE